MSKKNELGLKRLDIKVFYVYKLNQPNNMKSGPNIAQ